MPYISLDNLTQYNDRLRDYIDGSFDKLDGANWRKTSAGQSVSCWPIPESPLEPEVTFKFSEVPPESGTKGPDNPSTIVGVESVSCNVCESEGVSDTPYSIDLGGTYYGGTVNFATGVLEVTWASETISNLREFTATSSDCVRFRFSCSGYPKSDSGQYPFASNILSISYSDDYYEHIRPNAGGAVSCAITILKSILDMSGAADPSNPTDAEWLAAGNAYFNSHPFQFVHKINHPQTVPLTPVLVRSLPALSHYSPRQNTIYTPHESVQVGYAKSASKTSQDLANAIVALGGNV